jgi:hypothetical protein
MQQQKQQQQQQQRRGASNLFQARNAVQNLGGAAASRWCQRRAC